MNNPYSEQADLNASVPPNKFYIICSIPRTGSTLLGWALWTTQLAGNPREYFNPVHIPKFQEKWGFNDIHQYIDQLKRVRTSANGVFGLKLQYQQYEQQMKQKYRLDIEDVFPEPNYIFLTRKDHLAQAVSLVRARQTKRWSSLAVEQSTPTYNADQIEQAIHEIEYEEQGWQQFFQTRGITPFRLFYEDFVENYEDTIRNVLDFLEIELPENFVVPEQQQLKLADEMSEQWIARYRAEKQGSRPIKVSVKLITYNHEPFIAEAIESVLMQQTDFEYELIIGEDCSTDKTREIVIEYQKKFPDKIRLLLHEENLGPRENTNRVLQACQGQYVAFLDGDDFWTSPHKLQQQADFLDHHPECTICAHNAYNLQFDGSKQDYLRVGFGRQPQPSFTLDDILFENFLPTCSLMYRNNILDEIPEILHTFPVGDWIRNILHAQFGNIGFIDEHWGIRRRHAGGTISGKSRADIVEMNIKCIEMVCEYLNIDWRENENARDKVLRHAGELVKLHDDAANTTKAKYYFEMFNEAQRSKANKGLATSKKVGQTAGKIVIITEGFPALTETFILDQITGLIDRGVDLEIWTTIKPDQTVIHDDITRYNLLEKVKYLTYPKLPDATLVEWTQAFLDANDIPDIESIAAFHVHFGPSFNRLTPLFAVYVDKPVLVSFHGYDASKYVEMAGKNCYNYLFQRANLITTPSQYMKNRLVQQGADTSKVIIHRYGVDLDRFQPEVLTANRDEITLLSIGRMVPKKGLEYALRAFAEIAPEHNVVYRIIGEGPLHAPIVSLIEELGIEKKVKIEGFKDKAGVITAMAQADIFVLTSITAPDGDQEGVPVSLIEAHAMGLPVVSTFHAGIPELVIDQSTGLLAPEKDITTIAQHMRTLISDNQLRVRLGKNGRIRVEEEFNLEDLIDQLFEYLTDRRDDDADLVNTSEEVVGNTDHDADIISISIVIPTYNRAHYLPEAIDSALAQTYPAVEVLIVDDGSTDNTAEIVAQYESDKVRYLKKDHSGAPGTRNLGVTEARGDFILWLDSDDVLAPDTLENYARLLKQMPDIDICYGNLIITDERLHPKQNLEYEDWYQREAELLAKKVHGNFVPNPGSLIRKSCFDKVGLYDETFLRAHDYEWWTRAAGSCTFKHLNAIVAKWRWHDSNMSSESVSYDTSYEAKAVENMLGRYSLKVLFPDIAWDELHQGQAEALAYLQLARRFIALGQPAWAERYLRQSYDRFPSPEVEKLIQKLSQSPRAETLDTPIISVIIPTHNRSDQLIKAVQSVLNQTYRNFEIIVVNDDGVEVESLLTSLNNSNNITYIRHDRNKGPAAARNTGIRLARGKYVALLDDDDLFYSDHLETAVAHLDDETPVIYTDAVRALYRNEGDTYRLLEKRVPYSIDFDRHKLLIGNIAPVNCFVFDRELALKAGLFDETLKVLEDWDFFIRLSNMTSFKHVPQSTVEVNWRTDGTTVTSDMGPEWQQAREKIYKQNRTAIESIPNAQGIVDEFNAIWTQDSQVQTGLTSIIILTHNQLKHTKMCLESIKAHTPQPHELIIVDNGSTDRTLNYLRKYVTKHSNVQIISNTANLGFAAGNNQGLAAARGEYVLMLNNDTVVTEGWLARMLSVFERFPKAGLVGPVSNYVSGHQLVNGGEISYRNLAEMPQFAADWALGHVGQTLETDRLVGFCLLARREVINQIGGLDEQFGRGNFEDDDFCIRAALAGFKARIALDAFIHHTGNQTFKAAGINYYQSMLDNWELFKAKWNIPLDTPLDEPFEFPSPCWDAAKHFIPPSSGTTTPKQMIEDPVCSEKKIIPVNGSADLAHSSNLDDILTQVRAAQNKGNWPQAITLLRAALDQSTLAEDVSLLNSLGYCYVMNDQMAEAETTFEKGLEFDPNHLDLLSNLADLYLHQEQYDQATAYLNRALQVNPDDVNVLLSLGTCCIQLGVFDTALMAFQRVQVLAPETEGINETLDELETIALAAM